MRIWWLTIALGLSACSTRPVDYTPESPSTPAHWQGVGPAASVETDLLGLVGNTQLQPWLDTLLTDNPSLQVQLFELAEAGWTVAQTRAAQLPDISLGTDLGRERSASGGTSSNVGLALSSRWELDVWGRLADTTNAADLDRLALERDLQFARRSLAASFIKGWLGWVNAKQLLSNEQARRDNLVLTEEVIRKRYQSGLGSLQDLDTTRADLAQAVANVAAQREAVAAASRDLQQLLGELQPLENLPTDWPEIFFPAVDVPARVIGQRPDIMAAYQRIQAADARSVVAYKNLLPQFTLNLDVSRNGATAGELFEGDPLWSLLGQVTQPLFQGGRLRAELNSAQQRAAQAYWRYREQLVAALLEVEDGLSREQALKRQYVALERALHFARASQQHTEERYRLGLVSIQDLLAAKQTTFDTHSRLLQVALDRAGNRIDLGVALGLPIDKGA